MDPLEAARALLPAWVVWGPLYTFLPMVFVWALAMTWSGAVIGGRPPPAVDGDVDPHGWVERARRIYPARMGSALLALFLPLLAAPLALLFSGHLLPIGASGLAASAFVAAWLGAGVARCGVERRILPSLTPRLFVAGTLVRWLFFVWPLLLILAASFGVDDHFDLRSLVVLTVTGLLFLAGSRGGGIRLGRWLGLVRPADERVRAIVARVGAEVGHEANSVWVAETGLANAWVLFVGRELVWTSRALEVLDDDEVAAVAGHELGHLSESKAVVRARILRLMLFYPLCAIRPLWAEAGAWYVALLLVVFLFTMIFVGRLSRRMERRADDLAHAHEHDTGSYARALTKIYRANSSPVVTRGRGGVHGHLYDRLTATGTSPPYPRPEPPPPLRTSMASTLPLLAGTAALLVLRVSVVACAATDDDRATLYRAAAVGGADHQMLEKLAEEAEARGAFHEADVFFAAADAVLPMAPGPIPPEPRWLGDAPHL